MTVRRITVLRPPGAQGLLPVLVTGSDGQVRGGSVGPSGVVRFAPMRTRRLAIRFTPLVAPLQITAVTIPGVPPARRPAGPLRLGCGQGPVISVNGLGVRTRVTGTYPDVLAGRPVPFTACGQVLLRPGPNQVTEPATDRYSVQDVVLARPGARVLDPDPAATAPARVVVRSWNSSRRVLSVTAGAASYLVVNENFNAGWHAVTAGGQPLRPVRLDGWKQAWLLPAGTSGVVTLTYGPDHVYRAAIFAGLLALVLVALLALGRWPRARGRAPAPAERPGGEPASPGSEPASTAPLTLTLLMLGLALGLAAAGLWLGGWPGAVILPAAVCVFWALPGYWPAPPSGWPRVASRLSWPGLLPALLLAAAGCGAVGARLAAGSPPSPGVLWLTSGIPQILGLLIVARLVAELLRQ